MSTPTYGGQALIEGVLIRGRSTVAVALRHPDGSIVSATEALDSPLHRSRYGRWPLLRGLVVLYDTLTVGFRWLTRSANVAASAGGVELGRGAVAVMIVVALGLGIGVFLLLPLLLAQVTTRGLIAALVGPLVGGNALLEHFFEGLFRLAVFVAYLALIGRSPDIRRVFAYHGAEHMTIHAFEHGDPLVPERIRRYPAAHPRCGTEFILVVVVVSILAFSLLAGQSLPVAVLGRIALLPVIVGVSYELLRFGARHRANPLIRWVFAPGIWLQMLTTRQPDEGMVEVAIVSMCEALSADGESVPDGSVIPLSRSLVVDGAPVPAPVPATASSGPAIGQALIGPAIGATTTLDPSVAIDALGAADASTEQ